MRRLARYLFLMAALACVPSGAWAQDDDQIAEPAVLIADRVSVTADGKLIAEGNVEAFQGNQKISAPRIVYDRETETLQIDGPIRLTDGSDIVVLADQAQIDRDMQSGLLRGARMVLDEQLQLSALELKRGSRYSQLYKASVTACRVCEEGRAPLWQIRARRVVHDREERQLYFDDAQFMVLGAPVFYLPRLRMPDPSVERASGFLFPSIRTTSQLKTGIRIPYFFRLGDNSDLTITPYLSPRTTTVDLRYRRAFTRGRIAFEGGVSRDDLLPDETRGYLFGAGAFALGRGYELTFDIEWASDDAYLIDYGRPNKDRLDSEIALTRTERNTFTRAAIIRYQSLRDGENDSFLPALVFDGTHIRRYFPERLGGEFRFSADAHIHRRGSNLDVLGRDVARVTTDASWMRNWVFDSGVRTDFELGVAADLFDVRQDSAFPGTLNRVTPRTGVTFRFPMTRQFNGNTHFIEPVAQVGWSTVSGDDVPNDESGFAEFDKGNLLALSRFPAPDQREEGLQLAYGVNYARYGDDWQANLTLGQIVREESQPGFTGSSGLSGKLSDVLVAGQIKTESGIDLTARSILGSGLDLSKVELSGVWTDQLFSVSSTYLWLEADEEEGRTQDISEVFVGGAYRVNTFWTASASWRYNLADTQSATAGLGLTYRNECVEVGLTVNRSFALSSTVEPTTDFGFIILLRGFSATDGTESYVRSCDS